MTSDFREPDHGVGLGFSDRSLNGGLLYFRVTGGTVRGRNAHCCAPPALIRAGPIYALGSPLGESYAVRAKPILDGLHPEYSLALART